MKIAPKSTKRQLGVSGRARAGQNQKLSPQWSAGQICEVDWARVWLTFRLKSNFTKKSQEEHRRPAWQGRRLWPRRARWRQMPWSRGSVKLSSTSGKSSEQDFLRVHAEEVAVVDGLLGCVGPVRSRCSDLEEISKELAKEGRSSVGQGWSWIQGQRCWCQ